MLDTVAEPLLQSVKMGRRRRRPWLCLVFCSAAVLDCTSLPDEFAPTGRIIEASELNESDAIGYRTLTRDDFKGTEPPPHFAPNRAEIGAATCAYIRTTPEIQIVIRQVGSHENNLGYEATLQQLRFHARMDRECSWWNTTQKRLSSTYILQHEQIHFAIVELEARRLNDRASEISRKCKSTARTPEEASQKAQQAMQEQIEGRLAAILDRTREFDEDTSLGYRPERQEAWWIRIQAQLAAESP